MMDSRTSQSPSARLRIVPSPLARFLFAIFYSPSSFINSLGSTPSASAILRMVERRAGRLLDSRLLIVDWAMPVIRPKSSWLMARCTLNCRNRAPFMPTLPYIP